MHGLDLPFGVLHQHAGMAEAVGIGEAALLHRVAGGIEPFQQGRLEAALEFEACGTRPPGLAEEPARRIDGCGEALAGAVARQDLGLELRLAVAAHRAIGQDASILEAGEGRVQRVERLAARNQRIGGVPVEREGDAAVLPVDACRRQHAAGAVFPVDRLDIGDGEALAVDRAHPDRVAVAVAQRQLRRPLSVDGGRLAHQRGIAQEIVGRVIELGRIGDVAVTNGEGALRRLDQAVMVFERVELPGPEPFENAEDHQRGQPLRRRR